MAFSAFDLLAERPPDSWRENVAAIVLDAAGRVLLGLGTGHNAWWHFPQGGVGSKETLEEALRRELWEEVRLSPQSYRIMTRYGGLRYRYRKHNDKSGRWRGQEQTYFLVLCHQDKPDTDCTHTDEFCALTWVPWRELGIELFAPVKRKVVTKVLSAFFPTQAEEGQLISHLQQTLTPRRYRLAGRALTLCPADDRALFAGGKEEMTNTLARLSLQLRADHRAMATRRSRLLVLLHGAEGSGRKQCLRRLAACLDPLSLRTAETDFFCPGLPWELLSALPPAGGLSLVLHRPEGAPSPQDWLLREQWLTGQGISVLKLYLHTEEDNHASDLLAATDSQTSPWYIIPAEHRWYRDYVVALLVVSAMAGNLPE